MKNAWLFVIKVIFFLFAISKAQAACFNYEPNLVELNGTLSVQTAAPDPDSAMTKETYWAIQTNSPFCVLPTDDDQVNAPEIHVTEAQLLLKQEQYAAYKHFVGRKVKVVGSLFHSITAHHHTKVLINVSRISETSAASGSPNLSNNKIQNFKFKGADPVSIEKGQGITCYHYPDYLIVTQAGNEAGEDIAISQESNECRFRKDAFILRNSTGDYFFGLYKKWLFVDSGTSNNRNLLIYDLPKKKLIYSHNYDKPLVTIDGKEAVSFWALDDRKPTPENCPQFREWTASQMEIGSQARYTFDLNTMKKTRTADYRCVPME